MGINNVQTTPSDTSKILVNKLAKLTLKLQQTVNPIGNGTDGATTFDTLEKCTAEAAKALSLFYKRLSTPQYNPVKIFPDTLPDATAFNNNFIEIQDDLTTIFEEFENLESIVLSEFNYMVSRVNRLNGKMKSVYSSLGDLILFSNYANKDAVFFGDSFNNLDRIDFNSSLISTEQAEINQVEGIVTLPINKEAQVAINISELPLINSNSNGRSGNNEESGVPLNGDISLILDNNADTWFEYERVVSTDDGISLILDFTINLGEPKVINFIRINPNNFGTKTQIEILSIDTSLTGNDFISIKDDIPIAGFTVEDEENVFILAPSTSKFAGQGLYTFTPRKVKFVHLTFKQQTPYYITTSDGATKARYAIGIRDVDIQSLPYKTQGEIISTEYSLNEIRKVVLETNQNPSSSSNLVSVDHYISPDNGLSWYQINPKDFENSNQTIPKLLDFNGVVINTIKTSNIVSTLRYKAVLNRFTKAFVKDSAEFAQEIADSTELHTPPTTTPFNISLQNQPISGTLKLIDPLFGSRGKTDNKYNIAIGNGNKISIQLPFKPFVRDFDKYNNGGTYELIDQDPESIYVNGTLWTRGILTTSGNNYHINYETGTLTFSSGSGLESANAVPDGSKISMILREERLFPGIGIDHITKLNYPTSNDKKQLELYIISPPALYTQVLKKGVKRHQLQTDIIEDDTNYPIAFSGISVTRVDFIDGETELSNGEYSIDFENGMLYLYSSTSSLEDTTISYYYYPREKIDSWSFTDSGGITNAISIDDNYFKTFIADQLTVPASVKYFNLAHLAIVKGSVSFKDASGAIPNCLSNEVEFIDGRTELLGVIKTKEQFSSISGISTATNIYINLKMKMSTDTGFSVTFSNKTIFQSAQVSSLGGSSTVGDYYIDPTNSRIQVRVNTNYVDPGTVTYYYINPQIIAARTNRYSINYQTGEVFTYTQTSGTIYANYEYTNYRAKYDIARLVPNDDWSFDSETKKLTISDREILKKNRTALSESNQFYQASYKYVKSVRANIDELEPYFSPILKDYALKAISKDRLL